MLAVGDDLLDAQSIIMLAVRVPVGELESVFPDGGDECAGAVVQITLLTGSLDVAGDLEMVADGVSPFVAGVLEGHVVPGEPAAADGPSGGRGG